MKTLTLLLSALLVAGTVVAHTLAAAFGWTSTTHDFGKIHQGKPVTVSYTFTNKGEAPLLVTYAKGSCGCTGVDWPKEAVMPGATGQIKATFNAATLGAFSKTVYVESNADGGAVTLMFKGEVVAEGTAPSGR
ncbi:DUF1573 domain-containing protein [Fibrella forsythiae]|uniref:DUF1573 domain-containing protein n=1 Tax=Fibrella forsythiae TaxID=2817061 RepID=A0ABS3JQ72_9BACT|nr:DUF1573 domain-containing protein [Fibrella forsythiae]MBO0952149.1 DUF1573 domain-containing protein [Fibrella forsythiae]